MTNDSNNVYSHIVASDLGVVLRAVQQVVGADRASIYKSQFNGAETLHFSTGAVDFESTPLGDDKHLLNGCVRGTMNEVVAFVRALSDALTEANVEHGFEVYDESETLVQQIPATVSGPTGS